MQDVKRIKLSGRAIPVRGNDIDTDRIIPARFLKTVVFDGLGEHAFEDDRAALAKEGRKHSFDDPRYADARILLVNKNFGCGSSREHAPQAILRWGKGISGIIGESFAEIFFGNCVALGIPCVTVDEKTVGELMATVERNPGVDVVLDLEAKAITAGDSRYGLSIADGPRKQFLEGRWDSTAELLASKDRIRATAAKIPYFGGYEG
jgi:3-isopropylmalate/(R)-2-methylmalate dehydratase small subunit